MKVALYVRVSTEEQKLHGLSVDNQIQALNEYADQKGYEIVSLYNDAGFSGRKTFKKRPELQRLIADCEQKKIDLILFTKLDRWFRSLSDYYEVQRILDKYKVKWQAIWEDYETITSSGVFKVNIMLSVAQNEADKTAERVKDSIRYRQANGIYLGHKPPLGYKVENNTLVYDEATYEGVRAYFDSMLLYCSLTKAIEAAAEKGLTITCAQAKNLRINKAFCNEYYVPTKPYITKEEYEKIQAKRKYVETKNHYPFARLVYCHCGRLLTGDNCKHVYKGKSKIYRRYCIHLKQGEICDHTHAGIMQDKLEDYMLSNLEKIIDDKQQYDLVKPNNELEIAKKRIALQEKLKRIGDRYEDGDITRSEYTTKRQAVLDQIALLPTPTKPSAPIRLESDWKEIYSSLDDEHKNLFWKSIVSKIIINEDKSISVILL